jgi:hypothetical protein
VEPLLQQAADRPLTSLPGLPQLAQGHWRLGIDSAADQQRLRGVEALQRGALAEAAGALADALAAFERAASLDPLQSRPVKALARWHSRDARHYAERAAALNPLDGLPQSPTGADRP